jgi:hypothetical protein
MKYIYVILLILVLFVLVYLITEDKCAIENFTQIDDENVVCDDINANNTFIGDVEGKVINNSFCTYDYETVCNRPFANNFNELTTTLPSADISVCGDDKFKDNGNFIDVFVYEKDDNGNFKLDDDDNKIKIKLNKSEVSGNPLTYYDREVVINENDELMYKDGTFVYKQTNKIDNSKCKIINNKICRFPMSKSNVNSLYGITSNEDEFKSLVNNNGELMPGNMLTQGTIYDDATTKIRQDKKILFKELFFDSDTIEGNGLNLWDDNGFVDMGLLTSVDNILSKKYSINDESQNELSTEVITSYVDNFGNIINRKGYNLEGIPRNYYELVKLANNRGLKVALAVNKNANKYACGIATTKAAACDIALVRCKIFVGLDQMDELFKNQKSNLVTELKRRKSIYPVKSLVGNIVDSEVNISDNEKYVTYSYLDAVQKENHATVLQKYLTDLEERSLAVMYYRSLSHKEIFNIFKNNNLTTDEINSVEHKTNNIASLNTILKYIVNKSISEENGNETGILMVDNERYINYNNDATNIIQHCSLPEVPSLCNGVDKCNEAAVIGLNQENKCTLLQDFKLTLPNWNKYDLLPEQDIDNDKWINEKNEIHRNNKLDLASNLMDKCKMLGSECVMYKINGETYSYNTLFS